MNICIVNIRENNPYIGGVERVSYILGHDWQKRGHHVFFLSQYKSNLLKEYSSSCPEYFLPDPRNAEAEENFRFFVELLIANKIEIVINQGSVFHGLCELCQRVRHSTGVKLITVIHYAPLYRLAANESGFFIKEKLGTNILKWLIDTGLYLNYHLVGKRRIISAIKKELYDFAVYSDAIVCLSESFLPEIRSLSGESRAKIVAITNPVNLDDNPVIAAKKKQIIYVGRLELGLKRVDRLVKIWTKTERLFPDWSFHIVGDGDMRYLFERMARDKGLKHIYFDGFQDPDKYYAESSIICLTSSSEGFGMVLVEALRHQCIPIAYNSFSSLTDIIEDNVNGYCISPFNERAYLEKLHHLMGNESERIRLAANFRLTLNRFDMKTVSGKWMDLFKEII